MQERQTIMEVYKDSAASLYARSLIEAILDPLVMISADGKITDVNTATEKVTGCCRQELVGSDFSNYFTEPEKARQGYQEAYSKGFVTDYSLVIHHKDGQLMDVLYNASVYRNVVGEVEGVFAVARDVTERKLAEEQRKTAALYTRSLIEAILDPLVMINADGKITDVNTATEKVTGCSRQELISSDFSNYFTETEKARQSYQEAYSKGFVTDYPLAIRHKDGQVTDVLYNASVYRNVMGEVDGVFAVARDVTERKLAEEQRKTAALYPRSLIEAILDPLVMINADGKITDVNPATEKATGCSQSELIGSDFSNYFTEPAKARQSYLEVYDKGFVTDYPLAIRHKDGQLMDVIYNASVYRNEAGEVEGVFAVARDVTERKLVEEQLREKDVLMLRQSRLASMGEMIGNIAHQWRQPLNALSLVLGNIEITHQENQLTEEALGKLMEDGQRLIRQMSVTINDFRNFFKTRIDSETFSLVEVAQSAIALVDASFRIHNVMLELKADQDVLVDGYPTEFSQVLLNLLANAKESLTSSRRNTQGKVSIEIGQQGNMAWVIVRDNGEGISPPVMEKLFTPYFSTKDGGTGIGLYMSKMIVERKMHGKIIAQNVHSGAAFLIEIPLSTPTESLLSPIENTLT